MFAIEDERHGESGDTFATEAEALAELDHRAALAWDEAPNLAPCTGWRTCGRSYELVEYDDTAVPWRVVSRVLMLEVDAGGARWVSRGERE